MEFEEPVFAEHHRQRARLLFIPNNVLLNHLRPFYRNPSNLRNVGSRGLRLISNSGAEVHRHRPTNIDDDTAAPGYLLPNDVSRISATLSKGRDVHMPLSNSLRFAKIGEGLAIHLGVIPNIQIINTLQGTPLLDKDDPDIPVHVDITAYEHADHHVMSAAAQRLQRSIVDPDHRLGIDGIEIILQG